jgi:hypothetical protein
MQMFFLCKLKEDGMRPSSIPLGLTVKWTSSPRMSLLHRCTDTLQSCAVMTDFLICSKVVNLEAREGVGSLRRLATLLRFKYLNMKT